MGLTTRLQAKGRSTSLPLFQFNAPILHRITPPLSPRVRARYRLSMRGVAVLLLLQLTIAAIYCLFGLGFNGGLFKLLGDVQEETPPMFPGSQDVLVQKFTGVSLIDFQLRNLIPFWAPIVQRQSNALNLFSIYFSGQFSAGATLIFMESLRNGNRGRAVSYFGLYGLLFQNAGFALITPLYLLLHLLTSPVSNTFSSSHSSSSVLIISSPDVLIVPFSVTLGYIVPSILFMLPSPSIISSTTMQKLQALWQAFPVWIVITQWSLRRLWLGIFAQRKSAPVTEKSIASQSATYLKSIRKVYIFSLAMCMTTHIPIVLLALNHSYPISFLPTTLTTLPTSSFSKILVPPLPVPSWRMTDLANGVHVFLLWDMYISALSMLIWAIVLFLNASEEKEVIDPKTSLPINQGPQWGGRSHSRKQWRRLVLKVAFWTLVSGPFGPIVVLLWERDSIVKQKIKQGL